MELSAVRDTPILLNRCRGPKTCAAVCLPARPVRSVQVSSGSWRNVLGTASCDQAMRSSSRSNPSRPGVIQGGVRVPHPSADCQLPVQHGICSKGFSPHAGNSRRQAEDFTNQELYDQYVYHIAEELNAPLAAIIGYYVRGRTQDLQPPLQPPSEPIPLMIGGKLVDNLRGKLKEIVPKGPILYTVTAHIPGEDKEILLYLGQSGQGLQRMLGCVREDYFGDSEDSLKKAYMLQLAARGFTIKLRFVEVPLVNKLEELEKGVLKQIDFPLNKSHNGQVREPRLPVPLAEIIVKHPKHEIKAAQILRDKEVKRALDMHSTGVETMPLPAPQTLLNNVFGQAALDFNKMYHKGLIAFRQQVSSGVQDSGLPFVIAMTDFLDQCSSAIIKQFNRSELETVYHKYHGRLRPQKMSKAALRQAVLELTSGVAVSGNNDVGYLGPIKNVQEKRDPATPCNDDVLLATAASSNPSRNTSSTTCPASDDSNAASPMPGRRRSKAGVASAALAVNVSNSNNSQQQLTGGRNATSAGDGHPIRSTSSTTCPASDDSNAASPMPGRRYRKAVKAWVSSAVLAINVSNSNSNNSQQHLAGNKNATSKVDVKLSQLPAPVLQGLVQVLRGPYAAKHRPKGSLSKEESLVLLERLLPKQGIMTGAASSANVAMRSVLNKITPEYLKTATRPILDACYYHYEGRVVTSKDMKVEQLRDFLLTRISNKPSLLDLPLTEVVPSTSQAIKPSNGTRRPSKKVAIADNKSMPSGRRHRRIK